MGLSWPDKMRTKPLTADLRLFLGSRVVSICIGNEEIRTLTAVGARSFARRLMELADMIDAREAREEKALCPVHAYPLDAENRCDRCYDAKSP